MTKFVEVKDLIIGKGTPKICVPLVGSTISEILEEATSINEFKPDLVEWRADFFHQVEDIAKVKEALNQMREVLIGLPLVFTFRSAREGGEREISPSYYVELNESIIETGMVDLIDVELFNDERIVKNLISLAHANNLYVILSNHDFKQTPSKEEIISRLKRAQALGGDLPKIAVMPQTKADVLTLLDATLTMNEQYADRPIITMSMAAKGVISRLAGEIFGSAVTFGTVGRLSAPGQVDIAELRNVLSLIHKNS
ncbi:type I 3-dehydroquinate dehydratase [Bacillus sp. 31A1R]|uniref:3-dehydroquinate dehydratase n=1 Tax=Robertmurraya mangrovi TaxID=3098077 RepID=A0ABU5IYE1_9BACI|nr:type I 3-dehydroquinate dehydratase [Bacillus sp. 31A1R]MDZ5472199.1 type I 3-dehydroquinate dehydratase [Bacillus sp. 31A1R]